MGLELNVHRCITKVPHSDADCYERTLLYFLLYACDHHCSLSRGRPPITHEPRLLQSSRAFLMSEHANSQDVSLVFQIDFWSTTSEIFYAFGADIENPSMPDRFSEIKRFEHAYDDLHTRWRGLLNTRHWQVGPCPESLGLYIHCGKLYLYSHAFRGRQHIPAIAQAASADMKIFEEAAAHNALSMIRSTADMEDNTSGASLSMPSYFWTMLTFSIVVLIKLEGSISHNIGKSEVTDQMNRLRAILTKQEAIARPWHPLSPVVKTLRNMLHRDSRAAQIGDVNHTTRTAEDLPMDFTCSFDDIFGFDSFSSFNFNDPTLSGQIADNQLHSNSHVHHNMP